MPISWDLCPWSAGTRTGIVPPAFRPRALFPQARTVIVISMAMPPVVETTPSALHKELYDTTNRQLDDLAVALTRHLNRLDAPRTLYPRHLHVHACPAGKQPGRLRPRPGGKVCRTGTIGMNQYPHARAPALVSASYPP